MTKERSYKFWEEIILKYYNLIVNDSIEYGKLRLVLKGKAIKIFDI